MIQQVAYPFSPEEQSIFEEETQAHSPTISWIKVVVIGIFLALCGSLIWLYFQIRQEKERLKAIEAQKNALEKIQKEP